MDIKLRQRIVGVAVLIMLLIFCVFMLLRAGKKTQPHIPPINIEPPVSLASLPAPTSKIQTTSSTTKPSETTAPTISQTTPEKIPALPSSISTAEKLPDKTLENKKQTLTQPRPKETHAKETTPIITTSDTTVSSAMPVVTKSVEKPKDTLIENKKETKIVVENKSKLHTHKEILNVSTRSKKGHYIVQAGAFKEAKHVKSLTENLRKQGFVVNMHKIKTSQGELTLIFLGGKGVEKERAEHFKGILEKEYQLKPIVKEVK